MPGTTTTLPPGWKPFDEVLALLLTELPFSVAKCNDRIYHYEAYRKLDAKLQYPAIVYNLIDDSQEPELTGGSGFYHATYNVSCVSPDSEDIRAFATDIKDWNDYDFINEVSNRFPNIEWIDVDTDTEENEFTVEQLEKGYKTSSVTVVVDHWGDI